MDIRVVRKSGARSFMEGDDHNREYLNTGKINFGTSTLLPGHRSALDKGHPGSHEVFFVSRGHILLHVPDRNEYYELHEEDAILMPEGVPHILINVGDQKAVVTWSMAPCE